MTRFVILAALLGTPLLLAGPAFAVTVTNQDAKEHTLAVDRGVQEDQQTLAAGASANVECPERCEFRVVGMGYGRSAGAGDKLVIGKGGLIQFPNEATPAWRQGAA